MGIFGKRKEEIISILDDDENYNFKPDQLQKTLNYLVGLSDSDYKSICSVAKIHRKAYKQAAAVLGVENDATTFINNEDPKLEHQTLPPIYLFGSDSPHQDTPLGNYLTENDDDLSLINKSNNIKASIKVKKAKKVK